MLAKWAAIGAALTLCATAASAATSFDVASEGQSDSLFQFGYQTDSLSDFTLFTDADYRTSGCPIGGTTCYVGPASFLGVYFAPADGIYQGADLRSSEVTFHPGPNDQRIGVQFTAPTAGTYLFNGAFRAADAPSGNGIVYNAGGTTGVLGVREASAPFSFYRTLAAGESSVFSLFTVGNNGSYSYDTTGFQLTVGQVPEPATWVLMILGFGAVGFSMRKRQVHTTVRYA